MLENEESIPQPKRTRT